MVKATFVSRNDLANPYISHTKDIELYIGVVLLLKYTRKRITTIIDLIDRLTKFSLDKKSRNDNILVVENENNMHSPE